MRYKSVLAGAIAICVGLALTISSWAGQTKSNQSGWGGYQTLCGQFPYLCTDPVYVAGGPGYVGHDEPAVLFYSATPGAGNNFKGLLTLPKDPKTKPNQAGTAGTWNFQLHPAFWFGMAMCDSQSAPESTTPCTPDSDANIFNDSSGPGYIGNHPGTAFMEMQFYPPGWVLLPSGISCGATKWCAALNVDSYSFDMNHGIENNAACLSQVGIEPVNFAFITQSGNSTAPATPLTGLTAQQKVTKDVMLMNPGDTIEVRMFDNKAADPNGGFEVVIRDLTTGKSGSMTASISNGFQQINFDPNSPTCSATDYSFHPMYSTSTTATRVPWAAHSYNVAYSDEVGHFEYCSSIDSNGNCLSNNEPGGLDFDDVACFDASQSSKAKIGGCLGEDFDFDGVTYSLDWPGTDTDAKADAKVHARPIAFNGSLVGADGAHQFDSTAFETNLPSIESFFGTGCDNLTGNGCTNPPISAPFYPFFSSSTDANGGCVWQEGGANLTNSNYTFGGNTFTDSTEFGTLPVSQVYPTSSGAVSIFENYNQGVSPNPCLTALPSLNPSLTTIAFKNTKAGKSSAAKTIKLTNSLKNKLGLGVNNIVAQLGDATNFAISKNTCTNVEVLPKKHCTISVKGTPSSATTFNTTLTISSDASGSALSIPLSVTGE